MALTRKLLKGMGLTDEQVDTIIEAHTDTVDGLKADVNRYKADAERLPGVQKQLDDLKAAGDDGYKEKYEKEHSDFEAYKSGVTAKESKAAKEKAVRAYFESKNITGANLDLAMRGCGEEMAALELDGDPRRLTFTPAYTDLDINGHASHLRYIDWCCNIFGAGIMSRYAIQRFRIAYMHEVRIDSHADIELRTRGTDFSFSGYYGDTPAFVIDGTLAARK